MKLVELVKHSVYCWFWFSMCKRCFGEFNAPNRIQSIFNRASMATFIVCKAKQNKFVFVCAFPQIMNYSSANETCYLYTTAIRKTCRSTQTQKKPQFEKWASISTIVSLRRSHCSCDFSLNTKLRVDGTISTTFYSTKMKHLFFSCVHTLCNIP